MSVLDVGGGGGGLTMGLCQACPGLTAQVVDLPPVARVSEELVAAAGLPEVHDAAVLRNVLQVFPADRARRVVGSAVLSMRPTAPAA